VFEVVFLSLAIGQGPAVEEYYQSERERVQRSRVERFDRGGCYDRGGYCDEVCFRPRAEPRGRTVFEFQDNGTRFRFEYDRGPRPQLYARPQPYYEPRPTYYQPRPYYEPQRRGLELRAGLSFGRRP
jgi:hypothetical protein